MDAEPNQSPTQRRKQSGICADWVQATLQKKCKVPCTNQTDAVSTSKKSSWETQDIAFGKRAHEMQNVRSDEALRQANVLLDVLRRTNKRRATWTLSSKIIFPTMCKEVEATKTFSSAGMDQGNRENRRGTRWRTEKAFEFFPKENELEQTIQSTITLVVQTKSQMDLTKRERKNSQNHSQCSQPKVMCFRFGTPLIVTSQTIGSWLLTSQTLCNQLRELPTKNGIVDCCN